jgi:large-conductance mechanosensitive channel
MKLELIIKLINNITQKKKKKKKKKKREKKEKNPSNFNLLYTILMPNSIVEQLKLS